MSLRDAPPTWSRRFRLLSIVFAVGGVLQFFWFSLRVTRGPGGELEGVTLALGNAVALIGLGVSAAPGLVLAIIARRGEYQPRFSLLAIWLNSLALGYIGVVLLAGLFLRRAA